MPIELTRKGDSNVMDKKKPEIVVIGDVCIDWLQWLKKPEDEGLNWELYPGTRMIPKPGGTLLLAGFLNTVTGVTVISPRLKDIENISPRDILHSNVELGIFCASSDCGAEHGNVYRIKRCSGFTGPTTNSPKGLLSFEDDDPDCDMVVLDDAGNGFRDDEKSWPRAITEKGKTPIVIYKMHRPLASGKLWEHVFENHCGRLVVVVTADDLRASGMNISRCLSWERTAKEFVWQMAHNSQLKDCANLVVRFGLEGAIHYRKVGDRVESRLYFDPTMSEGDFLHGYLGKMQGFSSAFVSALAALIAIKCSGEDRSSDVVGDAVGGTLRHGLSASRNLVKAGFGNADSDADKPDYPYSVVCDAVRKQNVSHIADVTISGKNTPEDADPEFWCILQEKDDATLEEIAYKIVIKGEDTALEDVPRGNFGKLKTVDRREIESFHSIKNLMQEYIESESFTRPLSIAVFGSPGSGKSFGVTEIVESIASGKTEILKFNLSQFESQSDLISAFHRVRDIALDGRIPLVFFDEFDSSFKGTEQLGWLKYFLSPMQEGKFMERETMHPIGRSIFVFAGGTNSTFEEFRGGGEGDNFKDAKGPDFISRLRGYVDILGPNKVDGKDRFSIIRRAILLRSLLEQKVEDIFDSKKCARINGSLLHALLKVEEYKHGTRSIEAIIEMSRLNGRRSWEQADLPAKEQLALHVDKESFSRLQVKDVIFSASRERLAKAIHEVWVEDQGGKRPADDPPIQPCEELDESRKESNRKQVDYIQEKLQSVGCGYEFEPIMAGLFAANFKFTPTEVEILAEMGHERWFSERTEDGWTCGKTKDAGGKISPHLVIWGELTEDVKEFNRNAARGIPRVLAKAGFVVCRLKQ